MAYCAKCGNQVADGARYCSTCGAEMAPQVAAAYSAAPARTMVRPRAGRIIAGVCKGLAYQYNWDVAWVRFIAVCTALFGGGLGAVAYLVLWVVVPDEPLALASGTTYPTGG